MLMSLRAPSLLASRYVVVAQAFLPVPTSTPPRTIRREGLLTAADELHDLIAVASLDPRLRPFLPWQNFEITLDRNAATIQPKISQEIDHGSTWNRRPRFAVYNDRRFHQGHPAAGAFGFARS